MLRIRTIRLAGLLAAATLVAGISASAAHETRTYVLYDLGTLGGESSMALAMNDQAVIVGWAQTRPVRDAFVNYPELPPESHAFRWEQGVISDLGTLGGENSEARDVNNLGQIVGVSDAPGGPHAFVHMNGVMFDLNRHVTAFESSEPTTVPGLDEMILIEANGISDNGQIVGCGQVGRTLRGFVLIPTEGFLPSDPLYRCVDLGELPGALDCQATDLNDYDEVVGISGDQAFVWCLKTIAPIEPAMKLSRANAINSAGWVVGYTSNASGEREASVWYRHQRIDLGLNPAWRVSEALDVNDVGQIVGWTTQSGWAPPPAAVLWKNPSDPVLLDEVTYIPIDAMTTKFHWAWLEKATAVDSMGWIAGYGRSPTGATRAFVLAPLDVGDLGGR